MAYIGIQPAEKFTSFATQEFSTSATTSYTLDHAVANENELALFVNNVRQQPGSGKAYTATGTALTLSAATASTDTMYCVFLGRALQTVTPATNSITAGMVSANAITGAKLNTDVISAQTALASEPADTDEFLVSDAGTLKRIDYSLIKGGKVKSINAMANNTLNQANTNSTTFADISDLDLVVTPASTSSKFILFVNYNIDTGGSGHGLQAVLTYNHSGISQTYIDASYDNHGFDVTADRANTWQAMNYYLAPSTTNEITFRLQIASSGSGETVYFNRKAYRCIALEYE